MATKKYSVAVGSRWTRSDCSGSAKVMAFAENYAMLRFPGMMPFLLHAKDLEREWTKVASK